MCPIPLDLSPDLGLLCMNIDRLEREKSLSNADIDRYVRERRVGH